MWPTIVQKFSLKTLFWLKISRGFILNYFCIGTQRCEQLEIATTTEFTMSWAKLLIFFRFASCYNDIRYGKKTVTTREISEKKRMITFTSSWGARAHWTFVHNSRMILWLKIVKVVHLSLRMNLHKICYLIFNFFFRSTWPRRTTGTGRKKRFK